jgi:7-carboxy-7-deazaguanine synthase
MSSLVINEIFHSIQGESTYAGLPCIFIRLTYCNLRCSYCDTEYAFEEGKEMSVDEILNTIKPYGTKLVEVTGGEPLFQAESIALMQELCDEGYNVLLETGGSLSIEKVDSRVTIVMDLKCPSSNMTHKNRFENIGLLKATDEVKFVIGTKEDYDWAKKIIEQYSLTNTCHVLFSPVFGAIEYKELTNWILQDNLKVRFQLQMHKYIWPPDARGV